MMVPEVFRHTQVLFHKMCGDLDDGFPDDGQSAPVIRTYQGNLQTVAKLLAEIQRTQIGLDAVADDRDVHGWIIVLDQHLQFGFQIPDG